MSMDSREILTLQLGHYSNYVGAHWWNIQEASFSYSGTPSEINHDVLYREGLTSKNEVTFTPRLLALDLKGSLGYLSLEGELYNKPVADINQAPWPPEKVSIEVSDSLPEKSSFLKDLDEGHISVRDGSGDSQAKRDELKDYNLEENTKTWSDFLVPRFHPRSVMVTNAYQHNCETQPFDIYHYGSDLWKHAMFEEDFVDRIRNYLEECDNAQGFHVLFDGTDGFSGIASSLLEYLNDEYRSKTVLAFPLIPPTLQNVSPVQECHHSINFFLSLPKCCEAASLVVPLSTTSLGWRKKGPSREFQYLQYNPSLFYHSSAIIASALDTVSLKYRLKSEPYRLHELTNTLSCFGRRVASCSVGLPLGLQMDSNLFDTLEACKGPLMTSITPRCNPDVEDISQRIWMKSVCIRGVPSNRLINPERKSNLPSGMRSDSASEILKTYLAFISNGTFIHTTSSSNALKVGTPFPDIFKRSVAPNGDILPGTFERPAGVGMREVPMLAGFSSCNALGNMLCSLNEEVSKLKNGRFPVYAKAGMEGDEWKETQDQIITLAECYEEKFEC